MGVPVKVTSEVNAQVAQVAALRGQTKSQTLIDAWELYYETKRHEFADELEHAAKVLRDGTREDAVQFLMGRDD
jgi:hypothetical protein